MKITSAVARITAGLAVTLAGAAIALAPSAAADTSPLVPFGTNPQVKQSIGEHTSNHDEADTTNNLVDLPF